MRYPRTLTAAVIGVSVFIVACRPEAPSPASPALLEERDRLLVEKRDAVARFSKLTAGFRAAQEIPAGDILLGLPSEFVSDLSQHALRGLANQVSLRLRNLKVHARNTVKVKMPIIGKRPVGEFEVDVLIHEIRGQLGVVDPHIALTENGIQLQLPIAVQSGTGSATVHFKWRGKGVSDLMCGDLDLTRDVSGTVVPSTITTSGVLKISSDGAQLVIQPALPMLDFRLVVEPSAASWKLVQDILDDKHGVCGFILNKVDVLKEVRKEIAKGFRIKVHTERLPPVRVPLHLTPTVRLKDRVLDLGVTLGTLRLRRDFVWVAAMLDAKAHPTGTPKTPATASSPAPGP